MSKLRLATLSLILAGVVLAAGPAPSTAAQYIAWVESNVAYYEGPAYLYGCGSAERFECYSFNGIVGRVQQWVLTCWKETFTGPFKADLHWGPYGVGGTGGSITNGACSIAYPQDAGIHVEFHSTGDFTLAGRTVADRTDLVIDYYGICYVCV